MTQSPSNQAPQSPIIPELQSLGSEYKPESSKSPEGQAVSWIEMEAVVEFVSKGTGTSDGTEQGVTYTAYLLDQRPDRVAVCGLYISPSDFSLVLMDAAKACSTTFPWDDELARRLLFRVLYYINDPPATMIDPTITPEGDAFTITHSNEVYKGYTLKSCGHPIERRTVAFQSKDPNADVPIIKEQYVHCPSGPRTIFWKRPYSTTSISLKRCLEWSGFLGVGGLSDLMDPAWSAEWMAGNAKRSAFCLKIKVSCLWRSQRPMMRWWPLGMCWKVSDVT